MKVNLIKFIFSLLLIHVQLNLRPEKRQELLDKLTKKISISDMEENLYEFDNFEEDSFKISYDVNEIKKLMKQNGLPENYNFFDDSGAEKNIKNQAKCGCCWSFATTSSLAYRFYKYGINISLSAQGPVSCYTGDCEGNYDIDAQLNLVKNGTVTEECFPYKSADGKFIPDCPSQCEDGAEFKKYYSQNAYYVYAKEDIFKNLTILIMDQIVTQGPIMGSFSVYEDFATFYKSKTKCKNDVYSYDGVSAETGAHAITIVGYGILNNKIYWLVQNSWGSDWCDNGFIKMDIADIIELSFAEPNLQPDITNPVKIQVNFNNYDENCYLKVDTPSLDEWNNTLSVNFYSAEASQNLNFLIGRNKLKGKDEINCFYEYEKVLYGAKKGVYKYKDYESLGKENTFQLNNFQGKQFDFYGYDDVEEIMNEEFYISKIGSKIIFKVIFETDDKTLPPLYVNGYSGKTALGNCGLIRTSTKLEYDLGYCEITSDEFNLIQRSNSRYLSFGNLCGITYYTGINIIKLDTKNYPVFNVIQFIKPNVTEISKETDLILVSQVTGGTKYFYKENSSFYAIMEIENANDQNITENTTVLVLCNAEVNYQKIESNLTCHLNDNSIFTQYQNIYLLPYSYGAKYCTQFEVFIPTTIKAGDDPVNPNPKPAGSSSNLEFSLILLFGLLLLLF